MEKLAAKNATKVIDLLNERLAFERSGVKLYDTLLGRLRATEDRTLKAFLGDVKEHREEEKEHEEWLEGQIRALGGDAHAPTERSVLVQAESEGVERVMRRDDSILHDFHALLTAECIASRGLHLAGWVANRIDPAMQDGDANVAALVERLPAPLVADLPWCADRAPALVFDDGVLQRLGFELPV